MNLSYSSLVGAVCLVLSPAAFAQTGAESCAFAKQQAWHHGNHQPDAASKTNVADDREEDYDVKYVKLDLALSNVSTTLAGAATTRAVVTAAFMPDYVFELNDALTIDSVLINGQQYTATLAGTQVRTVHFPLPLLQGTPFTVRVVYHGTPPSGTSFISTGIRSQTSPTWGNKVTYTLSESYGAKDWWPCKQALKDKIDSSDVWLTVPLTCKAGSNGILENITIMPGSNHRFEWKQRNSIDYYLISLAVGKYVDYSYYVHYSGSNDSTLIQSLVYDNPATLPFWKANIDSTGMMMDYLSQLFGRYPFWKEKYGHSMSPLGGGIENQTMTTLGNFGTSLIVHELGHQWFGDNVTCGTWQDIWLNEGFASYIEYLFSNHFQGPASAASLLADKHTSVMSQPGGSVYVDDTTDENRIFNGRLTYDKGLSAIHTLRFLANDDTKFFDGLNDYRSNFEGGTATTADMQATMEARYGFSLTDFFDQWIYGEGFPTYSAVYNHTSGEVLIRLSQTTSAPGSIAFFKSPL